MKNRYTKNSIAVFSYIDGAVSNGEAYPRLYRSNFVKNVYGGKEIKNVRKMLCYVTKNNTG